jgi:hypothetical protein
MSWVAIGVTVAGAAVSAGSAAYSANKQKKAAQQASAATGKLNTTPVLLGDPAQVDPLQVLQQLYSANIGGVEHAREQATTVNRFNYNQAQKFYNKIAPGFSARQAETGSLIDQYSRGQIPADVQSSIQRATAQQGIHSRVFRQAMAMERREPSREPQRTSQRATLDSLHWTCPSTASKQECSSRAKPRRFCQT